MKRKLLKWVLPLLVAVLLVVTFSPASVEKQAKAQDTLLVAVVMPSAINDLAFSQSMYEALTLLDEELGDGFDFVYQDGTFVVEDARVAIREWALQGYDLIIAHGSQYGAIVEEVAPEFPDVSFAWGTDVDTFGLDNVFAYTAASQEGGFVNGVLAANLTSSDVIGVVGPIEVGDAKWYVDGFKAGVEWANPTIAVNVNYIGSFSDVALATEAAEAHVSNGADILTGSAQMVVGAVGVAQDRGGVLWFGTQANQNELAPDIVVANQVYHWEVVLQDILALREDGVLGGTSYVLTLENGGLVIEYNDNYPLSPYLSFVAESVVEGIIDGSIEVPQPE